MTQVAGLALCAVGNLATPDMARDLAMEVDKHLKAGSSSNIRKKAALCTVRARQKPASICFALLLHVHCITTSSSSGGGGGKYLSVVGELSFA